ncbi:hypothetical protein KY290_025416 [Solanum tuberosum]|uniref:BZIP domain-containing protein n=1 Tax=Solanum tuberosum TaxID=4113 RepID=A0ABQ7UTI3_SOLTU|nr:hypothetical protein KY290_025416 [Solanum tuberosum]
MGSIEDGKSSTPEKSFSTAPDQNNFHVYPDWAAMQAYYGHRVAVPPYVNSAVAPGHAPHPYMWGPLPPMMPPYGTPYAGVYAHGGVYPHPGVPFVSRPQAHGMTTSPAVSQTMNTASLSMDASAKSSGHSDQGLTSQSKGFNGLGMSIGNFSVDNGDGTDHGPSQSGQTEGSSDGSNIHTAEVGEHRKKRSREATPNNSGDRKSQRLCSPQRTKEVNGASEKGIGVAVNPRNIAEKLAGTTFSPIMTTTLPVKSSPTSQISPAVPGEVWLQNERELKREKRKQSNRESARRSRLRKQAEAEELAMRVQSLTSETLALRSEINKFTENSEKLKVENAALMERLKNKLGQAKEVTLGMIDDKRLKPVSTADLLARVNNNNGSFNRTNEDGEVHDSTSGAKLRQLLDASPRTDHAVAAR